MSCTSLCFGLKRDNLSEQATEELFLNGKLFFFNVYKVILTIKLSVDGILKCYHSI